MTKEEFYVLINGASFLSYKFAMKFLKETLVPEFRYDVFLNVSNDDPTMTKFDVYPDDYGKSELGLTAEEVGNLLFRDNKVPVWIDILVHKADKKTTTFKLSCSGRFSSDPNEFYYNETGTGPFGIKSPLFPIGYKEGEKFRLKTKPNSGE
jgi:hypothetical protein